MSVSKWLLSAVFMSMASQLSFAGDRPVSITPVLVPSDDCISEMNGLYSARSNIQDYQEQCKKPLVKETRAVLVSQMDEAKVIAQNTITACTPVYEKQTAEYKKTYSDIIELAKSTLREIDAFAKDTLDADPNYCMPQEE